MKTWEKLLLIVVVVSASIVILYATAHAWSYLDLLWFIRR